MRRFFKIIEYTVLVLLILVLTVPALVYVPWVQDYAISRVVSALNENDLDLEYEVGQLRLRFPLKIELRDVLMRRQSTGDTLAFVGHLKTAIDELPIEHNYIVVDRLLLEDVRSGIDSAFVDGLTVDGSLSSLLVTGIYLNLQGNEVRTDSIVLNSPEFFANYCSTDTTQQVDTVPSEPWFVDVRLFDINDANLQYDGWRVDSLQLHLSQFSLDSLRIHLDTLDIILPESHVGVSGDADFTYFQDSTLGWLRARLDASLSRKDLLYVTSGALPNMKRYWPESDASVRCDIFCTPDTLEISPLFVKVPGYVDIEGEAAGLHPFSHPIREADVSLHGTLCNADSLLSAFVAIPSKRDYCIPEDIAFDVVAHQKQTAYEADVSVVRDSVCVLSGNASFDEARLTYSADLDVNHLNVSEFVPSLNFENIVMTVKANGRYFDFGKRRTCLDAELNLDSLIMVTQGDSINRIDTFCNTQVSASLLKGAYKLKARTDLPIVSGDLDIHGKYLNDSILALGFINLSVPELGDFDSLYVAFNSEPDQLNILLKGGDASIDLLADCDIYKLVDVVDKVGRELDIQRTNQVFDINKLQETIPELYMTVDMQNDNPIMPVLAHYGVSFDNAYIEFTNTDSLRLEANIDTLRYDKHQVARVAASLQPNETENYYYMGNATYEDSITTLTYDLGVKATFEEGEIATVGFLLADSVPTLTFNAYISDGIDADVYLDELQLSLANIFLPNYVRLDGNINGHAYLNCDSIDFSAIEAVVWTDRGQVYYEGADMILGLPEDSIVYRDGQILFDNVRCKTQNERFIVVNGSVDLREDIGNPDINLHVSADKVRLIRNSSRKTRQQFLYGRLPLSANVVVKGKANDLKVDGSLNILSGCDLTYYYEDDEVMAQSQLTDLVEFVQFAQIDNPELVTDSLELPIRTIRRNKKSAVTVNLKVGIDKTAQVLVYLPTGADDKIQLQGGGDLKLSMDAGGKLQLGGEYDVVGGDINFKLPMLPVTKEFEMTNDSWLRWNGQPAQPEIFLTATEDVKCSINDAMSGARVVKFVVKILISGTLEKMNVTFTCSAPDDAAIENELSSLTDEELSKQALLLLVAQTYTGPSASTASAGLSSANAALNSLLNKEIESLVTNKLKHTEIEMGIDTYDPTGTGSQQTDYNLSFTQKFFNDRIKFKLGGKVSRGDEVVNDERSIINDAALEWMIKKDGSHYMRMFRKSNYTSVLEGQVVETGIGYVLRRQAYKFWQMIVPPSKKRQAAINAEISKLQEEERERESSAKSKEK
ncbi:MAG: translocation/assembly module TamB domain-containing protein [Bacteroidales bacterium]|nr:translocation/assembly module TamB domain-containing protein [Candidatus Liminaster caballi]